MFGTIEIHNGEVVVMSPADPDSNEPRTLQSVWATTCSVDWAIANDMIGAAVELEGNIYRVITTGQYIWKPEGSRYAIDCIVKPVAKPKRGNWEWRDGKWVKVK